MKKKCFKILSLSLLLSTFAFTGCDKEININFVTDHGTIVRTIKEGQNLDTNKIPAAPQLKGKYCLWDEVDYASLKEDITVNYTCYDTVSTLTSNMKPEKDVIIGSEEADLDYILKDLRLVATFEDGSQKVLYRDDIEIKTNGYDKNLSGQYRLSLVYNNKEVPIKINVKKINNYVTAILSSNNAFLHESFPTIDANTTVPGTIKFDDGQKLELGAIQYNWTFIPSDLNKYEVIHGKSAINVINIEPNTLTTNKEDAELTFEYNTTKQEIINTIREDLVVSGKFGDAYREISPDYYTIYSDYTRGQAGDNIEFRVVYDENYSPAIIRVNVKKNTDYEVNVPDVEKFVMNSTSSLDDVLNSIKAANPTLSDHGVLTFDEGQELRPGDYTYSYTFTPDLQYYAPKKGEVRINAIEVVDIKINNKDPFAYDYNSKTKEEIISDIKANLSATLVYSDGSETALNTALIDILIETYSSTTAGEYEYVIRYDEIIVSSTFNVNKRVLKKGEDFNFTKIGHVDVNSVETIPYFEIELSTDDWSSLEDFKKDWTIVPDLVKGYEVLAEGRGYIYYLKLIPNETISGNYAEVPTFILAQTPNI